MEYLVNNAADLREALAQKGPKTIRLQKGTYTLSSPLILTDDTEIIGGKGVVLCGSRRIDFSPAEGVVKLELSRYGIPSDVEFGGGPYGNFWKEYDIPKPHMDDCGPGMELYFSGRKMTLTRYPEKGYMGVEKCLGTTPVGNPYAEKPIFQEGVFVPKEKELFEKNDPSDLLLVGYWAFDWATQRHSIESYDAATGQLRVKPPYHIYGYCAAWAHFYALNVRSALKKPGDWYMDRKNGIVHLIPYKNQTHVDITVCDNLFEGENIKNVRIENIELVRCRKSAFHFENCSNLVVENCTIQNVGAWGLIADQCADCRFTHMHISHTGGGGIACSGGDRATLTPSGNVISHNDITKIAYWHRTYLAGIEINGVGNQVRFNKIHDVPHFAIVFQGNNHLMEGNEICNACAETGDAGAVYAGRDYTCRGNVIRYNYIHDIIGFKGKGANGAFGLYFDDCVSSAEVYGNIFANISKYAITLGGGRDYSIHDNVFYRCKYAMSFDDRGQVWLGEANQLKHLYEVPYRSEVWKNAYPQLYRLLDDEPKKPKGNVFVRNTLIASQMVKFASYCAPDTPALLRRENNTEVPEK